MINGEAGQIKPEVSLCVLLFKNRPSGKQAKFAGPFSGETTKWATTRLPMVISSPKWRELGRGDHAATVFFEVPMPRFSRTPARQ